MNTLATALARQARAAQQAKWRAQFAAPEPVTMEKRSVGRPQKHGSYRGYARHRKAGETPCGPCQTAYEQRLESDRQKRRELI